MSENILLDKELIPDDQLLKNLPGETFSFLERIRTLVADMIPEPREEWKYYGKKNGWLLKTFHKKRNLFFIIVCDGFFKVVFVFGKKAVQAVMDSAVSSQLKDELATTRAHAEGSGLSVTVREVNALQDIEHLLRIKLAN